jgi:hypothetical protein
MKKITESKNRKKNIIFVLIALSIMGLVFVAAIDLLKQKRVNEPETQKFPSTQIDFSATFVGSWFRRYN